MAGDVVIRAEGLGKKYVIGHEAQREPYVALREILARSARNTWRTTADMFRGHAIVAGDTTEEFWALKDVSFEVERGEVLGIIGRNGAGKSTLLKILSRITEPSEGRVTIDGRVASLLEVGTGFHPELTGRENIYLNGAILGMTRAEIRRKFDEIVAFAEVERFLDTPLKRYSSGMYVRLAFAVAAHLEPEILVVDEVLAVGDAQFQKKCLGKMYEVSRREVTILFVSHNMGVLASLCPLAIWLDHGSVRQQGATQDVIGAYLVCGVPSQDRIVKLDELPRKWVDDEDRLRLQCFEWVCDLPLQHGEPVRARIHFKTKTPLADLSMEIGFSTLEGKRLLSCFAYSQKDVCPSLPRPGTYSVDFEVPSLPLAPDSYNLDLGCRSGVSYGLDYVPAAVQVEIIAGPTTPGFLKRDLAVSGACNWVWNCR
jgi:lipopolysaccharide transport system ATP-binding protein